MSEEAYQFSDELLEIISLHGREVEAPVEPLLSTQYLIEFKDWRAQARDPEGRWTDWTGNLSVRDFNGEVGNSDHITRAEDGTVPLEAVADLPGASGEIPGEHRNLSGARWEEFLQDIQENGITDPIFITVDFDGEPVINEGNHRRDAAVELGLEEVPVEIRYFGHAEQQGTLLDRKSAGDILTKARNDHWRQQLRDPRTGRWVEQWENSLPTDPFGESEFVAPAPPPPPNSKTRFTVSPYGAGFAIFDNGEFHSAPESGTWGAAKKIANRLNDDQREVKMKFQPQLAKDGGTTFHHGPEWLVQRKWDGVRAIFEVDEDETRVFSRTGQDLRPQFPELANLHEKYPPGIYDGEILVLDENGRDNLEMIQLRINDKKARKAEELPATVKFFDILEEDGESTQDLSAEDRLARLEAAVGKENTVENLPADFSVDDIPADWEGTMSKLRASKYEVGKRRASWMKYKLKKTATMRITGLTPGIGARKDSFGAAIISDQNGVVRGQVGSGFTQDDIDTLMEAQRTGDWPLIEVEYRFLSKNGLLTNTAYKGIRHDKDEADKFDGTDGGEAVPVEAVPIADTQAEPESARADKKARAKDPSSKIAWWEKELDSAKGAGDADRAGKAEAKLSGLRKFAIANGYDPQNSAFELPEDDLPVGSMKWSKPEKMSGGATIHRSGAYSIESYKAGTAYNTPTQATLFRDGKLVGRFLSVTQAKEAAERDSELPEGSMSDIEFSNYQDSLRQMDIGELENEEHTLRNERQYLDKLTDQEVSDRLGAVESEMIRRTAERLDSYSTPDSPVKKIKLTPAARSLFANGGSEGEDRNLRDRVRDSATLELTSDEANQLAYSLDALAGAVELDRVGGGVSQAAALRKNATALRALHGAAPASGKPDPLIGFQIKRGGSTWKVVGVDGDKVTVENVDHGFTREWTRADLEPPQVDHSPVDDVDDDGNPISAKPAANAGPATATIPNLTPAQKDAYNRGWSAGAAPSSAKVEAADDRRAHPYWYLGFNDREAGYEKFASVPTEAELANGPDGKEFSSKLTTAEIELLKLSMGSSLSAEEKRRLPALLDKVRAGGLGFTTEETSALMLAANSSSLTQDEKLALRSAREKLTVAPQEFISSDPVAPNKKPASKLTTAELVGIWNDRLDSVGIQRHRSVGNELTRRGLLSTSSFYRMAKIPTPESPTADRIAWAIDLDPSLADSYEELAWRLYDEDEAMFPGQWDITAGDDSGKELALSEYGAEILEWLQKNGKEEKLIAGDSGVDPDSPLLKTLKTSGGFVTLHMPDTFSGWKVHINVGGDAAREAAAYEVLKPLIEEQGMGLKLATDKMQKDWADRAPEQVGKDITIYLPRRDDAKAHTQQIIDAVRDLALDGDIQNDQMLEAGIGLRFEFTEDTGLDASMEEYRSRYASAGQSPDLPLPEPGSTGDSIAPALPEKIAWWEDELAQAELAEDRYRVYEAKVRLGKLRRQLQDAPEIARKKEVLSSGYHADLYYWPPEADQFFTPQQKSLLEGKLIFRQGETFIHPQVIGHLQHLALLPPETLELSFTGPSGVRQVYVGEGGLPFHDDFGDMMGVRPRGWRKGNTWNNVAGGYDRERKVAVIGTGRTGSISLMLHELGHGLGHSTKLDWSEEMKQHHVRLFDKLPPYLRQGGRGHRAGMEEFFAEGFAHTVMDRYAAVEMYDEEFVSWIEQETGLRTEPEIAPDYSSDVVDKPDLETLIEAFRGKKPANGSSDTWHSIMSPLRRSDEATDQIATVFQATGGDVKATMRVLDSQTRWQGSWAAATDEWAAMEALGGNGLMHRNTRIALQGDPDEVLGRAQEVEPLTDVELAGFIARQEWHRDRFRELYPDGLEVYRGITGKPARKPYLSAIEEFQADRASLGAERQRYIEETGDYGAPATRTAESGPVAAPQYGLSSWTKHRFDASDFAHGAKGKNAGVVIKTRIFAEDVWMFPRAGVESPFRIVDAAAEVVVLNEDKERLSYVIGD